MKIFWAWQSDTPGNIGRFFVRDALNDAIEQLKGELEVVEPTERETIDALALDHDRKGVPGSPDLARTIMEKIEAAAVFVADVTPVGIVPLPEGNDGTKNAKKLINSNVAIELGYSLRARTDRTLLMVMNTHYGERADVPFDVAHKGGPIMFELAPEADKKTIRAESAKLKATLVEAIRLCVGSEVGEKKKMQPFPAAKADDTSPAVFFSPGEILASAGNPGEQEFRFPSRRRIAYLRVHPVNGKGEVGRARVTEVVATKKKPVVMGSRTVGGIGASNKYGPILFDVDGATSINSLTQGFKSGELWGVTSDIFREHADRNNPRKEKIAILPIVTLEKVYVKTLRSYVEVEGELGLSPPYVVTLGVVGLRDVHLGAPTNELLEPIHEEALHSTYTLHTTDDTSIKATLRNFFTELYDMAVAVRSELWTDEQIAKYNLPPR